MGAFRGRCITQVSSGAKNDPFSFVPPGIIWGLEIQGEGDGAVVAAEDVATDTGVANVGGD